MAFFRSLSQRVLGVEKVVSNIDLNKIIEYLKPRLHEKISVQDLARCVHLSPSHFHALFRQETNLSPHQFVINQRLFEAQRLLEESSLTLTEVALQTGFSSQSALNHAFKQKFNLTPGKFKRSLK